MKIVAGNPPNIKKIREKFNLTGKEKIVFTWGNILYNPNKGYIDLPLKVHESIHQTQQGKDPAAWWDRYLEDVNFRVEQEVEAYRAQYKMFFRLNGYQKSQEFLDSIARDLSGSMYGNVVSFEQARYLIE